MGRSHSENEVRILPLCHSQETVNVSSLTVVVNAYAPLTRPSRRQYLIPLLVKLYACSCIQDCCIAETAELVTYSKLEILIYGLISVAAKAATAATVPMPLLQ